MTVDQLIVRLQKLSIVKNLGHLPVELMIEFADKGQRQAPLQDIATSSRGYVVLIYEEPIVREAKLESSEEGK